MYACFLSWTYRTMIPPLYVDFSAQNTLHLSYVEHQCIVMNKIWYAILTLLSWKNLHFNNNSNSTAAQYTIKYKVGLTHTLHTKRCCTKEFCVFFPSFIPFYGNWNAIVQHVSRAFTWHLIRIFYVEKSMTNYLTWTCFPAENFVI